jgi:hypothetical protein
MEPLTTFESHVSGRNARVRIYPDRIEWSQPGRTTVANVLLIILAVYTMSLSLLAKSCRPRFAEQGRQMLALRSVQSVASQRDGLHTAVVVSAGANSISFRTSHADAARIEQMLRELVLGTHTAVN